MKSIRLLHTADLHLGAPLTSFGDFARERQRDFERTFERIITLAIEREVDCLLVAGDLFDGTSVAGDVVGRVQEGFSRLAGRGIAVVVIPGTHDNVVAANSVYRRYPFPDVHLLMEPFVAAPVEIAIGATPVFFYGFAYRAATSSSALASMTRRDGPGIHIGLLHGSLRGSPEWELRHKDLPFTAADLAAFRLDYVALGHYHDVATIIHDGRTIACYPGSPEGKRFGESGERCVLLTEVSEGGVSCEKVAVQSRRLVVEGVDASLHPGDDLLLKELVRLASPDIIARIRVTGTVEEPLDVANLWGRLQGRFAWLDLVDETDLFDSSYLKRLEREDSIRGLFLRKMQARREGAGNETERDLCREALKAVFTRFQGSRES